jgi:hypothetical protein
MNLAEFTSDFLESSLMGIELEGLSQEDAITRDILEYIKDAGDIVEAEICHFKTRGIKVNAYDYNDENDSIDIFITYFKENGGKVSDNIVLESYEKAVSFYKESKSGKLINKVDPSLEEAYQLIQMINQATVSNVRFFFLTNGVCSHEVLPPDSEEESVYYDFELWDIERVYQQYLIRTGKQKVEVDFLNDYNYKLRCLKISEGELVDVYLAIIPATILAKVYGRYKQGILEKNVRTFLQFRAKVNKGIRKTIEEKPDLFLAYNNGISTTAESVEVHSDSEGLFIKRILDWQIVNGGQTTASIHAASTSSGVDLASVYVQMKLSVVKDESQKEVIVPDISLYANTQNLIKFSDKKSNSEFHYKIEQCSRRLWIPNKTGGKATSKWFYERTRGQYLDIRSNLSKNEVRKFDIEYPKSQMFTKTDLAKYIMSWMGRPYDVSKGAEKNMEKFEDEVAGTIRDVSDQYYRNLIAKAILFKSIDRIVAQKQLGGYKSNTVTYSLAYLSFITNGKLDLNKIWEDQVISKNVEKFLDSVISSVWRQISDPPSNKKNITEWCKSPDLWYKIKQVKTDLDIIQEDLGDGPDGEIVENLSGEDIALIGQISNFPNDQWFILAKWAREKNVLNPFYRKFAYNLGVQISRGKQLSIKQARLAIKVIEEAKALNFDGFY